MVHQNRRHIGADRVERAVAERDLAVVAGQHVEAEQRDRVRQDQGQLEDAVVAEEEWHSARQRERDGEGDQLATLDAGHRYTRTTLTRPNIPDGRTTKTPTMTTSASVSLSSVPT